MGGGDRKPNGKPLRLDPEAESAVPGEPAFISRPENAPIYHGFPLVEATRTDGWCYGAISEYEDPEGCDEGDGFVEAADGSRGGIAWTVGSYPTQQICEPTPDRWGAYAVSFPKAVRTESDLVECFRGVLPELQAIHARVRSPAGRWWGPFGRRTPKIEARTVDQMDIPGPEHKRLCLIRLQHAVRRLALEASGQIAQYPLLVPASEEMALDFDHWRLTCEGNGYLQGEAMARELESIDEQLTSMSESERPELWTDKALWSHSSWRQVRALAQTALAAAKWPAIPPPTPEEDGDVFIV